jgi:hypothetical protein
MPTTDVSNTHFLNVDLDIHSKRDLQQLVEHLRPKVIVLFVGKVRRKYEAHLEVAGATKTPDQTIRALCRLIGNLPKAERKIWDAAAVRSFSIGVQAVIGSSVQDFKVRQETVTAVSEIGGEIVLTVYASAQGQLSPEGLKKS